MTIDDLSKEKAYQLYDSGDIKKIEVGTIKGLCQIHKHLFDELFAFARQIRKKNISKGYFRFASALFLQKYY